MTPEKKALFDALTEHRIKIANALEDPSVRGLAGSAEEKYTDQAHFVYELIQNADDAMATEARFILQKERLIFVHNGSKHFTVTPVENEEIDTRNKALGHVNAITSYANSTKTDGNSIGRFGLGFKAVLQYTVSPCVYDPECSFVIKRKVVPYLLTDDCEFRKKNETAFVLPFNHPLRNEDVAYDDIMHKLQNLVNPMLFLKNLQKVTYEYENIYGEYKKKVIDEYLIEGTEAKLLKLTNGSNAKKDSIWMFTRTADDGLKYSVGFFIDSEGKLEARDYYAFCFFPTKKQTNLGYIINAPFLLTDSREGIKAADKHNERMINLLAELAADCLVYLRDIGIERNVVLIDDDILNIIPFKRDIYIPKDEKSDVSLLPFYEKTLAVMKREELLPSFSDCAYADNSFMANAPVISKLFSNEQLEEICGIEDAKWVFTSKGWEAIYRTRDGRADYLREVIPNSYIIDTKIIDMITPGFVEKQSEEWLLELYDFICDTDLRVKAAMTAPIFLTKSGKAISAYNKSGKATLFIDDEDSKGYEVVSPELLKHESTRKLVERLGIKTPELKDKIFNKILKKDSLNGKSDFRAFLDYYIELIENDEDTSDLIDEIKDKPFIIAISEDGTEQKVCSSEDLYFPTDELKFYFEGTGEILFVCLDEYNLYLKKKELKYLDDFLSDLGVSRFVRVYRYECDQDEIYEAFGSKWPDFTRYRKWYDYCLDEDELILNRIVDNADRTLSELLWKQLVHAFDTRINGWGRPVLGGVYEYFFRSDYVSSFEGFGVRRLKNMRWIADKNGLLKAPSEISIQEIGNSYDVTSGGAKKLLAFLKVSDEHPEYEDLDDSVRQKLEAYDIFASMGLFELPEEKVKQLMTLLDNMSEKVDPADTSNNGTNEPSAEEKVIKDITERVQKKKKDKGNEEESQPKPVPTTDEADGDEMTKAPVDYTKKIEQAKQKCEDEIAKLVQVEEARNTALASKPYSYAWFTSLLQLEAMASGDDNASSREVSICFAEVEREDGTARTLILKHPDKNIPQVMEELVDIPLDLTFSDGQTKRLIIEVANVQSYTLRVKVKQDDYLNYADFDMVTQAKIVAQNPTFLTRELQKEFSRFGDDPYNFDDDYDMQQNLCENIRFIFGPPGTGKTTYLVKETLIPLAKKEKEAKILVLTPTNKAADVLVSRIMQVMGDDKSYEDWLIRYGVTGDEEIEKSPVFHGKEFEIDDYKKCVIVTTMARLPYDYFIDSTGNFNHLHGINWDYIVVDEASMIPLVQMVYMLYLKTPKKFIIAGDPFQIEPTTAVSDWKSENIYKMVNLEEFSENAETIPHKYEIKLLTKQYRSVASIGEVFSQLTYNGVLEHARDNEDARPLNIEKYLEYENLNIIRFPVSQFESIYRAKRLKLSSYQVYSALFVYEFASYISQALARENGDEVFRIGIIAPYGAQAGLIDKLIASVDLPDNIEIGCGTIHGFQGDECDVVIALFNPPPHISTNKEMFLNRQNIINVAISRAKDYLFVLVPDDDTENVQNLWLINKLKKLIEMDFHTNHDTKELEELLFDNRDYLEENAFATGHQSVNVYGLPEKRYEIRSEDNALDVQVHGSFYYIPFETADEEERVLTIEELSALVIGKGVFHPKWGSGIIEDCDGNIVGADFDGETHKFSFPRCFDGFLKMQDTDVEEKIVQYLNQ